ncbi:plakophilin-1 isoform X2 [Ctenopharyngodon idella]|uniref:plakophilin-1 isoform X2 n=1 Tax=Ctenopharyngodon idella TaxID=7959 RepID=UPI0022314791|nr:plakophilin-1 isoform X2 [Ctenopharyngodon idella]
MTAEPIRSALGSVSMDDTSLVLPSDKKQRTGEQRVLEQVKSIKRSKSKMVKSDSIPSPTTPASATEFSEPKFQFSPTNLNGTLFKYSGSSMMTTQSRVSGRSLSVHNTVRRQSQNSQWDSQMNWNVQSQSNGMKSSGSDPALSKTGAANTQKTKEMSSTVRYNRATARSMKLDNSTMINASRSQTVKKITKSKSEASGANGATGAIPDITLQEAVEYLTHSDVSYQLCGASFIQHQTFKEDTAKQEVWRIGGIPALVQLLKSDNSQLQQTAAAALRNVVFKENEIKLEVESCEGLEAILTLLRNTNVTETQKQLTGLLWNLSSADALKPELIRNALPMLTESIVVPFNFWTDSNTNKHIDPEVFYNTTGCLRNLSCASEKERISMRNCTRLIDSLMTYVQTQVERGESDDKSVENCVCILHNLSYQLEKEAPEHFTQFSIPDGSPNENMNKNSLFSPRSTKTQKFSFPAMEEGEPEGVKWLYHRKSLQLYLTLLGSSQKEAILEACCGALQNLTASKSPLSTVMSQSIIQKQQGLSVISPLLNSANSGLQKTAMSLVGNMSRVTSLRSTMAKEVLPKVSSVLLAVTPKMVESDSSIATACRVMHTLMLADPESGKKVLNSKLIDSLSLLSTNVLYETARKAAAVLLWSMWGQKDIQNVLKKQGMNKDTFINDVTATAYKAATIMKGY